jgi:hypothetical protein
MLFTVDHTAKIKQNIDSSHYVNSSQHPNILFNKSRKFFNMIVWKLWPSNNCLNVKKCGTQMRASICVRSYHEHHIYLYFRKFISNFVDSLSSPVVDDV